MLAQLNITEAAPDWLLCNQSQLRKMSVLGTLIEKDNHYLDPPW